MERDLIRIVPAGDGPNARGTRFFQGDTEIVGVSSVKLEADGVSGVWVATITMWAEIEGEVVAHGA